eukprot:comp24263_c0_seq1/m.45102 comp24263_c0_seq1/g.45102  ORF comp24263_c0_seq1/g.45102 comp24263_c0_seq1/m.45102 type:complete len:782 (-) comp24263_c0_seq1:125-2470(-)
MDVLKDNIKDLLKKGKENATQKSAAARGCSGSMRDARPVSSSSVPPPRPPPPRAFQATEEPTSDSPVFEFAPESKISTGGLEVGVNTRVRSASAGGSTTTTGKESREAVLESLRAPHSDRPGELGMRRAAHITDDPNYHQAMEEACRGMSEEERQLFQQKMSQMSVMLEQEQAELAEQESKFLHLNERAMLGFGTANLPTVRALKRRRNSRDSRELKVTRSAEYLPSRLGTGLSRMGFLGGSTGSIPTRPPAYSGSLVTLGRPVGQSISEETLPRPVVPPRPALPDVETDTRLLLEQAKKENDILSSEVRTLRVLVTQTKAALASQTQIAQSLEQQRDALMVDKQRVEGELSLARDESEQMKRQLGQLMGEIELLRAAAANKNSVESDERLEALATRLSTTESECQRLLADNQRLQRALHEAALPPPTIFSASAPLLSLVPSDVTAQNAQNNLQPGQPSQPDLESTDHHDVLPAAQSEIAVVPQATNHVPNYPLMPDPSISGINSVDVPAYPSVPDMILETPEHVTVHLSTTESVVDLATRSHRDENIPEIASDIDPVKFLTTKKPGNSLLKGNAPSKESKEVGGGGKRRLTFEPMCLWLDSALAGDEGPIDMMIKRGFDVDKRNDDGLTALHNACCGGHPKIVALLLAAGADPNVTDFDRWTPLHGAACFGQVEVVRLLLQYGASPRLQNDDGDSPLDLCEDATTSALLAAAEEMRCAQQTLKALYSYTSKAEDELSIVKGDTVTRVFSGDEKDWWVVKDAAGNQGLVPSNYLGMASTIL